MTATAIPAGTASSPVGGVRFGNVLRSEWVKLRSVRSTVWSLAVLVVASIGFTVLFTALTSAHWNDGRPAQRASVAADPTSAILGGALGLSQLAVCVLGVLVVTAEYSTGTIRATLLAVPRRTPVLLAKAVVFGTVILVIGEAVAFVAFFVGSALLRAHAPVAIGDPGVLRAVIGAGLYLTVLGFFSLAVGTILRHSAAAITGVIAFVLVLAPLTQLIPGTVGEHIHAYLPTEAGQLVTYTRPSSEHLLSAWQGFGVFCAWTAALLVLGGWLLHRRDA